MAPAKEPHRKLAAILSADAVGYSRLMQADEAATVDTLNAYRAAMRDIIAQHNGRVVNAPGDALLAEFPSVIGAVSAAVEIQTELEGRNASLAGERRMPFRIGIHLGDVIEQDDGTIYGDGVNIAARMEALADGGGVCVSSSVFDAVEGKLAVGFDFLGEQQVKNIAKPVRVYRVRSEQGAGKRRPRPAAGTWRWQAVGGIVLLLGALVAVGLARYPLSGQPDPSAASRTRVAVLPFANISADPNDEYFADGMTEELISRLSRISGLEVIARTSVMKYKGTDKDIAEIGRELSVGSVLEGSVRKALGKVRVTAQLISVSNQAHLWSEDYDRQLEDVFAIQSEIAKRVAGALSVRLAAGEQKRIETKGTRNPEAHEWYLKGLYQFNRQTKEGLDKGRAYLERAVEQDPAYAHAYWLLASSLNLLGFYGYLPMKEVLPQSKVLLIRALELDDTLAEAHADLAMVRTFFDWDWSRAEGGYKRALSLNPNSAAAHDAYAILYLSPMGRFEEAIAAERRAIELDPLSTISHHDLGWIFNHARRWDQAIKQFHKVLEMEPDYSNARRGLGFAYAKKGMFEQAFAQMHKEVELTGGSTYAWSHLGWAYGLSGRRDEALKVLDTLKQRGRHEVVDPLAFAEVYLGLGENDAALGWLDKATEEMGVDLLWVNVFALWDPLRPDPRFAAVLKKIGLSQWSSRLRSNASSPRS